MKKPKALLVPALLAGLLLLGCPTPGLPQPTDSPDQSPPPIDPSPIPSASPHTGPRSYPFVKKNINPNEIYSRIECFGNTLFVSDQNYGLVIYDVTNPDDPRKVSTYTHPGYSVDAQPNDFAVIGNYLLYTSWMHGTVILDISDVSRPRYAASIPNQSGNCNHVEIAGNSAYISNTTRGLLIYDVSVPASPVYVGNYPIPSGEIARDFELSGNAAFLLSHPSNSGGVSTIRTIDLSDKTQPAVTATYIDSSALTYGLYRNGGMLYAFGDTALLALDAVNPLSLQRTDILSFGSGQGGVCEVAASGTALYVGTYSTLFIVDAEDPLDLQIAGSALSNGLYGFAMDGDRLYATGYSGRAIQIVDITAPYSPAQVGYCEQFDSSIGMAIDGNRAYIANEYGGLLICDISSLENASVVGQLKNGLPLAWEVAASGDYAYVAGNTSFYIVNVQNPSNPLIAASMSEPARAVAISGAYAYIGAWDGLKVIDISAKSAPVKVATMDAAADYSYDFSISGSKLFSGGSNGYRIIDIGVPAAPVLVYQSQDNSYAASPVLYRDRYLHVVYPNQHVYRVFDIATPAAPTLIYESETIYNFSSISIRGDKLYTVGYHQDSSDLAEWDITDPANPTLTAYMIDPTNLASFTECVPTDDNVYAICTMYGMYIFEVE